MYMKNKIFAVLLCCMFLITGVVLGGCGGASTNSDAKEEVMAGAINANETGLSFEFNVSDYLTYEEMQELEGTKIVGVNGINILKENIVIPSYIYKDGKNYRVVAILNLLANNTANGNGADQEDVNIDDVDGQGPVVLKSLTIPSSVVYISENAFYNCYSLEKILLEDRETEIIGLIQSLNAIKFTENFENLFNTDPAEQYMNYLGNEQNEFMYLVNYANEDAVKPEPELRYAYSDGDGGDENSGLSVVVNSACRVIGEYAFSNMAITDVVLPFHKIKIGARAFYRSDLQTINLPEGLENIGEYAFNECHGITTINFPSTLRVVGDGAFEYCTQLTSIYLPDLVKVIGNNAFDSCWNVASVRIPNGIETIGGSAFSYCGNFNNYSAYTTYGNARYLGNETNNYLLLVSALNEDVRTCTTHNDCRFIGSRAFKDCTSLTSVTISASVENIGASAFYNCSALRTLTIPSGVKKIGAFAFTHCSFSDIIIPSSVTVIESETFSFCYSLRSITLPSTITKIGSMAFYNCNNLKTINYDGGLAEWANVYVENNALPEGATIVCSK